MILKQLVDYQANRSMMIRRQEELENDLLQLQHALDLGHIDAAQRIIHNALYTLSEMRRLSGELEQM